MLEGAQGTMPARTPPPLRPTVSPGVEMPPFVRENRTYHSTKTHNEALRDIVEFLFL